MSHRVALINSFMTALHWTLSRVAAVRKPYRRRSINHAPPGRYPATNVLSAIAFRRPATTLEIGLNLVMTADPGPFR